MHLSSKDIGKYYRLKCDWIIKITRVSTYDRYNIYGKVLWKPSFVRDPTTVDSWTNEGQYYTYKVCMYDIKEEVADDKTLAWLALEGI